MSSFQSNAVVAPRAYARIIVEKRSDETWGAWFADLPICISVGKQPSDAIRGLFDLIGKDELRTSEISQIDYACADGHLEYRVPFTRLKRLPTPSTN